MSRVTAIRDVVEASKPAEIIIVLGDFNLSHAASSFNVANEYIGWANMFFYGVLDWPANV